MSRTAPGGAEELNLVPHDCLHCLDLIPDARHKIQIFPVEVL